MREVGPVLRRCTAAQAVAEAIKDLNQGVRLDNRGGYLRVRAPGRCAVSKAAIESYLGAAFRLPGDLEVIMPSYLGRLSMTAEEVRWE